MDDSELAQAVLACRPFGVGRRGDGTVLPDYFNGHQLLADPRLLAAVADRLCRAVQSSPATRVAGEVSAGSALAVAVSLAGLRTGRVLPAHGLRREPKTYGVPGWLTVPAPAGSVFAVLDDVAGTGQAVVRGIRTLRRAGHEVCGAFVILDRGDGTTEAAAAEGVPLTSLFRLADLRAAQPADRLISKL